MALLGERLSGP